MNRTATSIPTSWVVARDLGYSFKAIETVTHLNETITAGELVDRLMDLDEHAMNHHLERRWIEDVSLPHCNTMTLARSGVKKVKKVRFATDVSDNSSHKSDFRKKLEEETFQLLCERNCVTCFKQERSLLFLPCSHNVMCSTCYNPFETLSCPLCDQDIASTVTVYRA